MLELNQVAFSAYKTNDINHIYFFLNKGICHCFIFIPSSITYKTSKFLGVFLMSWSSFIKTQSLITPLQLMDFINCFLNIWAYRCLWRTDFINISILYHFSFLNSTG